MQLKYVHHQLHKLLGLLHNAFEYIHPAISSLLILHRLINLLDVNSIHGYLYFVRAHRYQPPKQRFFYYAVVLAEVLNYYQNASADTIETLPLTVPKVPSGAWRYSL